MRTSPGGSATGSSWRSTWPRRPASGPGGTGSTSGGSSSPGCYVDGGADARAPEEVRAAVDSSQVQVSPKRVVMSSQLSWSGALRCVRLLVIRGGPGGRDRPALRVDGEAQLCVVGLAIADFGACLGVVGGAAGTGLPEGESGSGVGPLVRPPAFVLMPAGHDSHLNYYCDLRRCPAGSHG